MSISECALAVPCPADIPAGSVAGPGQILLGRAREVAALRGLAQGAPAATGGALVLRGEPGAGKTALLAAFAQFAGGRHVLRLAGIEAEANMAWAALHRLLLRLPGELDRPSGAQREAVRAAASMPGADDMALVESVVRPALAGAAREAGLVLIVDDLQWIDRESRAVLHGVARQAPEIPLVLVAAICEPAPAPALTAIPELVVTGLGVQAGAELLVRHAKAVLDRRTAEQLAFLADGNPLVLSQTGRRLAVGQADVLDILSGQQLSGLWVPARFLAEIRALPEPSRALLTLAACDIGGDTTCFWSAAAALGLGPQALAPARRSHVIMPGPGVRFRHRLLRIAALDCASPRQWRACHKALAEACRQRSEPAVYAWHRAAAAVVADDETAARLARRARLPASEHDALRIASWLAQAARLSETDAGAVDHYLAASAAALTASAPRLADDLLHRAHLAGGSAAQRARADRLAARLSNAVGAPAGESGHRMLVAAVRLTGSDLQAAAESLQEAAQLAITTGHYTRGNTARAIGSALLRLSEHELSGLRRGALLPGLATLLAGDYARAVPLLRQALRETGTTWQYLPGAGAAQAYAARALWDDEHVLAGPGPAASSHDLVATLSSWAAALAGLGHLREADQIAGRARRLAESIGWNQALLATLHDAELCAWRGDGPATAAAASRASAAAATLQRADIEHSATAALMTLHLSRCQYAQAFTAAGKLSTEDLGGYANQALPVLVEAGTRLGHHAAARRALSKMSMRASASGTAWALGVLSMCEALIASDSEAADVYERSITLLDTTAVVSERARARLLYGEWLRRKRQRTAARTWLSAAGHLFRQMGAVEFARRAQRELDSTVPPGRRDDAPPLRPGVPMLTPAERRIAEMAAAGATNKEIAIELFVSRRTVDHHLRNTYGKLGVSSRRQLGAALSRRISELSGSHR